MHSKCIATNASSHSGKLDELNRRGEAWGTVHVPAMDLLKEIGKYVKGFWGPADSWHFLCQYSNTGKKNATIGWSPHSSTYFPISLRRSIGRDICRSWHGRIAPLARSCPRNFDASWALTYTKGFKHSSSGLESHVGATRHAK